MELNLPRIIMATAASSIIHSVEESSSSMNKNEIQKKFGTIGRRVQISSLIVCLLLVVPAGVGLIYGGANLSLLFIFLLPLVIFIIGSVVNYLEKKI